MRKVQIQNTYIRLLNKVNVKNIKGHVGKHQAQVITINKGQMTLPGEIGTG